MCNGDRLNSVSAWSREHRRKEQEGVSSRVIIQR